MPQDPLRYKYSLTGEDALEWLADRYMVGEDQDGADVRLVADEIVLPDLRLARLWHTSAVYRVQRPTPTALVLLQAEGVSMIEAPTWKEPVPLGPGDVAVLPGRAELFLISTSAPTARYELDYDLTMLPHAVRAEIRQGRVFTAPAKQYRDAVASTCNAALNSGLSMTDAGFSDYTVGLRHLMTALVLQGLEPTSPWLTSRSALLHRGAMQVIRARAADPDFDVDSLAAAVRTSPRNLRHVFAQAGSTAKAALTEERVRIAETHLSRNETGASVSQDEIAQLSGFPNARALRRAVVKRADHG